VELGQSLGASRVIDYTREDFANERRYDVMLDIIGNRSWLGPLPRLALLRLLSMAGGPAAGELHYEAESRDLSFLAELMDAVALTPVVEVRCAMDEAIGRSASPRHGARARKGRDHGVLTRGGSRDRGHPSFG
jgi:hypothetical protein